jgi:hypothetical protein
MSTLTVPDFNESGLGDRMCGMLLIAVYTRIKGHSKVKVPWPKYSIPGGKPPEFRKTDILLENVLEHLILPKVIEFVGDRQLPRIDPWWYTQVGIGSPDFRWFANTHLSQHDIKAVMEVAKSICSECGYKPKLLEASANLGEYVAVHIRRTDKVRPTRECTSLISDKELDDLDNRTKSVIEALVSDGHSRFYVCSDDDSALKSYQNHISNLDCEVVSFPEMEKAMSTYYDLAAMSNSTMVVQSMRNSAFSNYAACIGGVPLWNVYMEKPTTFL